MNNKEPNMISSFDVMSSELISYSDMLKECTSISVSPNLLVKMNDSILKGPDFIYFIFCGIFGGPI